MVPRPGSLAHNVADVNEVEYNGRSLLFCSRRMVVWLNSLYLWSIKNQRLYELLIHEKCQSKNVIVA